MTCQEYISYRIRSLHRIQGMSCAEAAYACLMDLTCMEQTSGIPSGICHPAQAALLFLQQYLMQSGYAGVQIAEICENCIRQYESVFGSYPYAPDPETESIDQLFFEELTIQIVWFTYGFLCHLDL